MAKSSWHTTCRWCGARHTEPRFLCEEKTHLYRELGPKTSVSKLATLFFTIRDAQSVTELHKTLNIGDKNNGTNE